MLDSIVVNRFNSVCRELGFDPKPKLRTREMSDNRFVMAHLLYDYGLTLCDIGELLGRDHSTITYMIGRYWTLIDNKSFKDKADKIKSLWEKSK